MGDAGRLARALAARLVRAGVRLAVALAVVLLLTLGLGPLTGAYRTLNVLSSSMAPTIPAGAVIFVTPEPPESLTAGEIITFSPPDTQRVITHRVLEVVEPGPQPIIRTIGDANPEPDPWTAQLDGRPVWRTRAAVPYLGYLVTWLRSPAPRTLALYVAPALFVVLQLRRLWRPAAGPPSTGAPADATGTEPDTTGAAPHAPDPVPDTTDAEVAPRRRRVSTGAALGLGLAMLTTWVAAPAALAAFSTTTSADQGLSTATLTPPTSISGTPSGGCPHTVTLSWTAVTGTIATGYRITRTGTPSMTPVDIAGISTTSYVDSNGLTGRSNYTYTIYAVRGTWVSATGTATGNVRTANC